MRASPSLPQIEIERNGSSLPGELLRQLYSVRVQQRLSMPALCELVFIDATGAISRSGLTENGCRLRVGLNGGACDLFAGEVTGVDYSYRSGRGREVRVRGYDVLNRLGRRQSVRAFVQTTIVDIARELTSDLGLSVSCDVPDHSWDRIIQHDQTDLQLLAELAEREGFFFFLRDGTLRLTTLDSLESPLVLRLGEELLEANFARNDVSQCAAVSVAGWDTHLSKPHTGAAQSPRLQRSAQMTGGSGDAASGFKSMIVNRQAASDAELSLFAQAELDFRAAQRLCLTGVANGDPRLRPGSAVVVEAVEASLAGPYPLTAVTHLIDAESGYVCEVDTAPVRSPPRRHGLSATLGVVSRTDDPDGLGRIQLALPAFGEISTDWVQAVSPWAGAGKGFMAQPDVDDLVLFICFDADLTHGVVLGSFYGSGGPPKDWSKARDGQCYSFTTPGGQRFRLDDAKGTIKLEDNRGGYVELAPHLATIHAKSALHIEAPGQPVVIRGATIDFEQA
ncbi:MAG: phage baseplate assembly protein V [Betaproteobacteria bacterium]